MNSSKNKLNSEIILIFNPNPNAHLLSISMILEIFFIIINPLDSTSYFLFFKLTSLNYIRINIWIKLLTCQNAYACFQPYWSKIFTL